MKNQPNKKEIQKIIKKMLEDAKVRRALARESHLLFFGTYFGDYAEYEFADFHYEMFALSENKDIKTLVIMAGRGMGKSTILNTSLAIWSIVGIHQKKFVFVLSQTQAKAKQHYLNIKRELEHNALLRKDLGPFKEDADEWGSSLTINYYDARIIFASTEQSIRGMRHRQYRPDLVITDDLDDNDSVRTLESRDKTYNWLTKDILPAGKKDTRLVSIGTILHRDSVIMRLRKEIFEGARSGVYRQYPLVDDSGVILWSERYPNDYAINEERMRIGNEQAWQQEYLLNIIADSDRVINPEWIRSYKTLPKKNEANEYRYTLIGVDLAISKENYADYTAMVAIHVYGWGDDMKIYVLPNPINERLDFPEGLEKAKLYSSSLVHNGRKPLLMIEDNQYQKAFPQMLEKEGYRAEGVRSIGDKRSRFTMTSPAYKNGQVFLPETGAKTLHDQLVGFPVERRDDLLDALTIVIAGAMKQNRSKSKFPDQDGGEGGMITDGLLDEIF